MKPIVANFARPSHYFEELDADLADTDTIALLGIGDVTKLSLPAILWYVCDAEHRSTRIVLVDVDDFDDVVGRLQSWELDLPGPVTIYDVETDRHVDLCPPDAAASEFRLDVDYCQIRPGWLDYDALAAVGLLGERVTVVLQLPDRLHTTAIAWAPVVGLVVVEKPLATSAVTAYAIVRANTRGNIVGYSHWIEKEEIAMFLTSQKELKDEFDSVR